MRLRTGPLLGDLRDEQGLDLLRAQWRSDQSPLRGVAPERAELLELRPRLDSVGDDPESERVSELDQREHDRRAQDP